MIGNRSKTGFALLVSLIVVSVVLSVGLVILDLSIKQVRLSTNARDSEIAFHAANAGMECARYWRREERDEVFETDPNNPNFGTEKGDDMENVECFGVNPDVGGGTVSPTAHSFAGADAQQYEYYFSWGDGTPDRCTRINMLVVGAQYGSGDQTITYAEIAPIIPDYPNTGSDVLCVEGSRCTIISVQGYNQVCPAGGGTFGYGVVERKVLLEF